jgi:hypothetical protein
MVGRAACVRGEARFSNKVAKKVGQVSSDVFDQSRFAAVKCLFRHAHEHLALPRVETEAQKFQPPRAVYRALAFVDAQAQHLAQKPPDPVPHGLACTPASHVDLSIVGITHEATSASFQLCVQVVEQDVGQPLEHCHVEQFRVHGIDLAGHDR